MKAISAHRNTPMFTRLELTWQDVKKLDRKLVELMAVETVCEDDMIELETLSKRIEQRMQSYKSKFDKSEGL